MADNSIDNMKQLNSGDISPIEKVREKIKIKNLGRPIPDLKLIQEVKVGTRIFTRHFSKDVYNRFNWISGCDKVNAIFCFPCVLFCSDETDKAWSATGIKDLKHLHERARKHEITTRHIQSCMELCLLGSTNIKLDTLDSLYRKNVIKHNEQVTRNRCILKKLINCIKFCGKLEHAFLEHNEQYTQNRDIFRELIDFSSEMDVILKDQLDNSKVFKETSKTMQNEILESMLAVCHDEIKQQVDESDFLAIQCDETSDISNQCQMVLIVRYYHNGNIYERFWGFLKVVENSAEGLAQCIEHELEKLISNSPLKLIAQTYDGGNVMSDSTCGVQSKIKQKYRYAHFVHCYAHQLNLMIQKATNQHAKVKLFFSNLSAIPNFFSSAVHRGDLLKEIVNRKLPGLAVARWDYNIHTVNAVFDHRDTLIECFEELEEKCNKTVTCKEAYSLRMTLEDVHFIYWLQLFHKIFPRVDILFNKFQTGNKTSMELKTHLEEFERLTSSVLNSTDDLEREDVSYECKRRRILVPEVKDYVVAEVVCDSITSMMKERLSYRGHLEASSLVNVNDMIFYSQNFPEYNFKSVLDCYPMLDRQKLKTELEVLYSTRHFKKSVGVLNILSWLYENGLNETLSEVAKLLKIIVTTPMPTAESERCFSTLNRTKIFLKNALREERLNVLAMISVNRNLIHEISNFDEKVIEHFISQKNRRQDFVYRQ